LKGSEKIGIYKLQVY